MPTSAQEEAYEMQKEVKRVNVSSMPELLALAEEVRKTREPRLLKADDEDLALLVPIKARPKRKKTKADYEAFLSSAGSWKGIVDTDRFDADTYESRRRSSRSPVEL